MTAISQVSCSARLHTQAGSRWRHSAACGATRPTSAPPALHKVGSLHLLDKLESYAIKLSSAQFAVYFVRCCLRLEQAAPVTNHCSPVYVASVHQLQPNIGQA